MSIELIKTETPYTIIYEKNHEHQQPDRYFVVIGEFIQFPAEPAPFYTIEDVKNWIENHPL